MIERLKKLSNDFGDGLLSEREYIDNVILALADKAETISCGAPFSGDKDIEALCWALMKVGELK